jgi:DNA-binding XRE family transcriptional regulator
MVFNRVIALFNNPNRKRAMIRTETDYRRSLERLEEGNKYLELQRQQFRDLGLTQEETERAMGPTLSFHEQIKEEIELYEKMKRGDLGTLTSLTGVGYWLIGLRIAKAWTQKELAEALGVSEAQVSRDETNEYHGITLERAQRILEMMGLRFRLEVDLPIQTDSSHVTGQVT